MPRGFKTPADNTQPLGPGGHPEGSRRPGYRSAGSPGPGQRTVGCRGDSLGRHDPSLPAGGSSALGIVIGAILIVFIILLITDILGYTSVFPFTKKHR